MCLTPSRLSLSFSRSIYIKNSLSNNIMVLSFDLGGVFGLLFPLCYLLTTTTTNSFVNFPCEFFSIISKNSK